MIPTKLVVEKNDGLQEVATGQKQNPLLRAAAVLFSYIFHPVFVPVYVIVFLLFIQPFLFVGFHEGNKVRILLQTVQMYTFYPLVSVLLLKALKFISSIKLETRKDRIIPFIICNIWYFWLWYIWRNMPQLPTELVVFAMSVFLASSIGLLFNIYIKISMHAIAVGTAVAFLTGLSFQYPMGFGLYLSIAFLIGGAVCTSRLILNDHNPAEIYWGIATGAMAVMLANIIV